MQDLRCAIIGSGNVATHLGKALYKAGVKITQVYSKTPTGARVLAKELKAKPVSGSGKIKTDADLYLICVKDDAIVDVVKKLEINDGIVVHTSGSVSIDVLKKFNQYGVIYPLQTFSKNRRSFLSDTPICIEANDKSTLLSLSTITSTLSDFVYALDSAQRTSAHLAAVFANNFTNHMYAIADGILKKNDLPFDIIRPLILETAMKVLDMNPVDAQTGPAKRGDKKIIAKHLAMLKKEAALRTIYTTVSASIKSRSKRKSK